MDLHPTDHRGFRELHAIAREVNQHWATLAGRLHDHDEAAAAALDRAAEQARELIDSLSPLTAARGVHGGLRAHVAGRALATGRSYARDTFLERNQALRLALTDAEHLATLLAYLAARAERRSDEELAAFFGAWERRIRRTAGAVRGAAVAQAADPDGAIEPVVASPLGRAAHGAVNLAGTFGEWADRRAAGD